jgi:cob(I)alamin adenosyltransferase
MKIYTRTGDSGESGLYDGTRTLKSEQIFDVLGTLDELGAQIGMFMAINAQHDDFLKTVQQWLLNIGSIVATPSGNTLNLPVITSYDVSTIETKIDEMDAYLRPLKNFIIMDGVNLSSAQAHICRTVCRRAERELVRYGNVNENIIKLINRLSDYFFTLSRYESEVEKDDERNQQCSIM